MRRIYSSSERSIANLEMDGDLCRSLKRVRQNFRHLVYKRVFIRFGEIPFFKRREHSATNELVKEADVPLIVVFLKASIGEMRA